MRARALLLALGAMAGCGQDAAPPNRAEASAGARLEAAAIARGLVRDPARMDPAGLYARGSDRLCIVPEGDALHVGAFVDYGQGIACSGSGRAEQHDDALRLRLGDGCSFEAGLTGDRIAFPGTLPAACDRLCSGRASFAGFSVERMSESASEARALRSPGGEPLCAS